AQPIDHPTRPDAAVVGQPLTFGDGHGGRGVRRRAPTLGEHTESILAELGIGPALIAELRERKVV
ncbi:MAG: formyl-CoA transferase, partial [Actinomycetota bacterium]|nr:formyl-CoA transferase [Actinomycetota bacterium]